jgi:hypothetical protein
MGVQMEKNDSSNSSNHPSFARVKDILDSGVRAWEAAKGCPADLLGHGLHFCWKTKQELLASVGHGKKLIQPEVIGKGCAERANLIIALRAGFANAGRMPLGGPYISTSSIQEIEDWINAGCPD